MISWQECPTVLVGVRTGAGSFSFWADEVNGDSPMILPALGVAITVKQDRRSLAELITEVISSQQPTALARMAQDEEDSYTAAAKRNRQLQGPIWRGLGPGFPYVRLQACGGVRFAEN